MSKVKKVKVYQFFSDIIVNSGRYYVTSPSPGAVQILWKYDNDPDLVKVVPLEKVMQDMLRYSRRQDEEFQLTARDAIEAAKYWAADTPPVPPPVMFSYPGDSGLTFSRLPWRPMAGNCPTWDTMLSRMSNSRAFKAWVGSLFFEDSYSQQYVWLYGKGNDGKGSMNRFLARVFGPAYCSKQPKGRDDKHWTSGLIGKRLTVFPDCNDAHFVTMGFFKSLTGGDPVEIEGKYKDSYTTILRSKYLILSNERPTLSSEIADRRRAIYCEIESRPDINMDGGGFEDRLWSEGGAFLSACMDEYQVHYRHLPIPVDDLLLVDLIETNEVNFEEIFDFYFQKSEELEFHKWAKPIDVQRVLKGVFSRRREALEFLAYLERKHGIRKKTLPNKMKAYSFLSIKSDLPN